MGGAGSSLREESSAEVVGTRSLMTDHERLVRRLLDHAGVTYADEAGIHLGNTPMPLFQLLTLCMLASKPIEAAVATSAALELFSAGVRTPKAVLAADRGTVIEAFGRAGYARYDESSATRLTDMATRVRDEYSGDLRNLAIEADQDPNSATVALMKFDGIGDIGAAIFLREVQDVWTWARPYFDERATSAAASLGLPIEPAELGALAPRRNALLAAALVRVALDPNLGERIAETSSVE